MTASSPSKPRPLSPHLGIYKPQISSIMSILHRATGVALAVGLIFLSLFLTMMAGGEDVYAVFIDNIHDVLGELAVFGTVLVVVYIILSSLTCVIKKYRPSSALVKFIIALLNIIIACAVTLMLQRFVVSQFPAESDKVFYYIGEAVLFGWTLAFFYHFWCGIRHLMWDAGWFLTIKGMHITGWLTLAIATISTLGIWLKIWGILPQ